MILIPAIDLIDGRCVRLRQGSYDDKTVYDEDPVLVAQRFVEQGARRIHLVDLDAARGSGDNRDVLRTIRSAVDVVLEVGGGVRSLESVEQMLDLGIDYAVVGTMLARDPEAVAGWAARHGERMLASIDARDGVVQVSGWQEGSGHAATELAARAGQMGFAAVEYTNIARDGMLSGPDIPGTLQVARSTSVPVILSGGVSETKDVEALMAASAHRGVSAGISGVIVGRAIYEGQFDVRAALRLMDGA